MWALDLLTLVVLGVIAWEDLRARAIHWWLLPLLFAGLALPALLRTTPWYADAASNLLFLALQFAVALALLMLRHRRWGNPVGQWVGSGDLLFLLVVALALPRWGFLLYYLTGLTLSIPAYLLMRRWRPRTVASVPLAGFLAIHLAGWLLLDRSGVLSTWPMVGLSLDPSHHG